MKLPKILLSLSIMSICSVFATASPEITLVNSLLSSGGYSFTADAQGGPLIATPTTLQMTNTYPAYSTFNLTLNNVAASHDYVWFLMKTDGTIIHYFPFQTDSQAQIVPQSTTNYNTFSFEQLSVGETFFSLLYDMAADNYTLDFITPFPLSYTLGSTRSVSMRSKLPLPVVNLSFTKLNPSEFISVNYGGNPVKVQADANGRVSTDLWIEDIYQDGTIAMTITDSAGSYSCPFFINHTGARLKAVLTLQTPN